MGILSRKKDKDGPVEAIVPPQPREKNDAELYETLHEDRDVRSAPAEVVAIRRNGAPPTPTILKITDMSSDNWDGQTMIIRYSHRSMLSDIRNMMSKYGIKNASAFISPFIETDVYVNINESATLMRGKKWLSVVYECLDGNPNPTAIKRYPNAMVITVRRTIANPELDGKIVTLDMLVEGRR